MAALIEIGLEGQYAEHLRHIALYVLDAILLPSPYFRRNIIINRQSQLCPHILGNAEVEARIVDKNHRVGAPPGYVTLARAHVGKYGRQVQQHRNKPHVSQFAVVAHPGAAYSRHQVAAEKPETGLGILAPQRLHQLGSMQVATCLACYDIVFHSKSQLCICLNIS